MQHFTRDPNTERIAALYAFLNMTSKSGLINPRPVIREIVKLLRFSPEDVESIIGNK